jgi:hypothetical protein
MESESLFIVGILHWRSIPKSVIPIACIYEELLYNERQLNRGTHHDCTSATHPVSSAPKEGYGYGSTTALSIDSNGFDLRRSPHAESDSLGSYA